MVEQIHQAPGGNFRSVDMIIPRILELEQRNRQKLADKMNEIIVEGFHHGFHQNAVD